MGSAFVWTTALPSQLGPLITAPSADFGGYLPSAYLCLTGVVGLHSIKEQADVFARLIERLVADGAPVEIAVAITEWATAPTGTLTLWRSGVALALNRGFEDEEPQGHESARRIAGVISFDTVHGGP